MAILNNNPLVGASGNQGGYNINNSLRFRQSASAYLSRTASVAPTSNQKGTFSFWMKRGLLGYATEQWLFAAGSNSLGCYIPSSDRLSFEYFGGSYLVTTQVFRDPSAWYHIVLSIDTTQATAANRVKLYVNGNQVTAFSTEQYPSQNATFNWMASGQVCYINQIYSTGRYFDGYLADVNFIDGSAKTPSDFGETDTTTGVWKPKAYTGTYGTNGFYLKFSDIATTSGSNAGLGKDFSGNANYWTTNNISVTSGTTYDAMKDSPTNTSATVANYAVMSPINTASGITVSNANLRLSNSTNGGIRSNASISVSSGKWYFEVTDTTAGTFSIVGIGQNNLTSTDVGTDALSYGWYLEYAQKVNNGSSSAYGTALTSGDVCMVAFDLDNNKLYFGKNGTWFDSGNPATGTNPAYTITAGTYNPVARPYGSSTAVMDMNFGQRPFTYTPPTGFVRLNTFNLPTPTILQGNKYMDATTYTGNGASSRAITNAASFRPDFVWIKQRSSTEQHQAFDSIRGATKVLNPNQTTAETTDVTKLTAFNSDGFSIGSELAVNANGSTYVAWQWQAGQGTTSSNTSGSITSTVSVNTTAGFSVVTYTGTGANATVGHGLGVAPRMMIIKCRSAAGDNWRVYHASLGATKFLDLNQTSAAGTATSVWNDTAPTSTVWTVGTNGEVNRNTSTYVGYIWAEIAGFSKFGSYTGNGSTDGSFIYLGFRPKFVLFKNITTAGYSWQILDTSRNTYNTMNAQLFPNSSAAEDTTNVLVDYLSNGIKLRNGDGAQNLNSNTYIYMAFAESPFKNSLAR